MLVEIEEIKREFSTSPVDAIESIVSTVNTTGVVIRKTSVKGEMRFAEIKRECYSKEPLRFFSKHKIEVKDDASVLEFEDTIDKEVENLISVLYENQRKKTYNDCMYKIYNQFSTWNRNKSYSKCDRFLRHVVAEEFDVRILLSMLMASLPMKHYLNFRREFYDSVLQRARLVYPSNEIKSIFVGLD